MLPPQWSGRRLSNPGRWGLADCLRRRGTEDLILSLPPRVRRAEWLRWPHPRRSDSEEHRDRLERGCWAQPGRAHHCGLAPHSLPAVLHCPTVGRRLEVLAQHPRASGAFSQVCDGAGKSWKEKQCEGCTLHSGVHCASFPGEDQTHLAPPSL